MQGRLDRSKFCPNGISPRIYGEHSMTACLADLLKASHHVTMMNFAAEFRQISSALVNPYTIYPSARLLKSL